MIVCAVPSLHRFTQQENVPLPAYEALDNEALSLLLNRRLLLT